MRASPSSSISSLYSSNSFATAEEANDFRTSLITEVDSPPSYRSVRDLPPEILHQIMVYLEVTRDGIAVPMLNNLLVAGVSAPSIERISYLPPPSYLGLACTFLVHPLTTTRPRKGDHLGASSHALMYLQNVLSITGPVNSKLDEAFAFAARGGKRIGGRRKRRSPSYDGGNSSEDDIREFLLNEDKERLASDDGLWHRAEDFWHAVGWAFNCSVRYRRRWDHWKVWLKYMVDVLIADWRERSRIASDAPKRQPTTNSALLSRSLIIKYLIDLGGRSGGVKRALKAIFANGTVEEIRMFPEVFEDETIERKQAAAPSWRASSKLDIENGSWGDYNDDEFDNSLAVATQSSEIETITVDTSEPLAADFEDVMGGSEAMALRLRLISLISRACEVLPDDLTPLADTYTLLYEHVRPLPLSSFALFIYPPAAEHLTHVALSSLIQVHLRHMLPNAAPASPNADDAIDQAILEECFLPFAANTSSAEDNAKLSILVESLLRVFLSLCETQNYKSLRIAVIKGIEARNAKCAPKKRTGRATANVQGMEKEALGASGRRMKMLLDVMELRAKRGAAKE